MLMIIKILFFYENKVIKLFLIFTIMILLIYIQYIY